MEKLVYAGKRFQVFTEDVHGRTKEIIKHPGAVVIIPILDDGKIVMIKNERFVVNKTLWELPAGTIEKNEDPLHTAKREVIEETGYASENVEYLFSFYSTPGICDEIMHIYTAKSLTFVGQQLEETEKITVHSLSLQKLIEMIYNHVIEDGKTIASLLYYKNSI